MQIKKTAFATAFLILASQAWATIPKKPVVTENYPEDILTDSIGIYVTPRGQQILSKSLPILRQNGMQINKGVIPEWDYAATGAIDLQKLPAGMASHQATLKYIQDLILKDEPHAKYDPRSKYKSFNNPMIKLKVKGISYDAQITHLSFVPDLEETQFLHTPNTIVVEAQIEASKLKLGVSSIVLNDSANSVFNNGDIGLNGLSITSAANSLPLMFTIPLSISLDEKSHITIKALRIDDNLSAIGTVWDYSKLILPALRFIVVDQNDKNALKDGEEISFNWGDFEPAIRTKLPDIAKAAQAYLSNYVKENGLGLINTAFSSALNVNTLFQEVNTMAPPGAPTGTVPVPYMWGLAPHTLGLTDQFLFTEINTFIEDPLSQQHIGLPSQDSAKTAPNMAAIDPSTYDLVLRLDEGFVNRLLQLSFLRGYFNSIPHKGSPPLKLVVAPTITADKTTSPDQLKMHVDLDYTNDPTGELNKLEDSLAIRNPLEIAFDMSVIIKSDPATGAVTLEEGPIDVDTAQVLNGIKLSIFKSRVISSVQDSLTQFNQDLATTPSALSDPFLVPNSIAGIPIVLKTVQADPSGNIMIYVQYGDFK